MALVVTLRGKLAVGSCRAAFLVRRPGLRASARSALLSFERPAAESPWETSRRTLKTAQLANASGFHRSVDAEGSRFAGGSRLRRSRSPSRYKGYTVDALASGVEEGRGRLR